MSILAPVSGTTLDVNGVACGIRLRGEGEDAVTEEVPEEGGMQATVEFTVPWGQRYDLIKALAGSVTPATSGTPVRTPPWAYPENPLLYVRSIGQIRGIGPYRAASGFVAYRIAVVPAVFARPKYDFSADGARDPSGQPWTTTKFRVTADVFSPTFGGTFFWLTSGGGPLAGKPVPESATSLIFPHAEISMTRHWMPYVPLAESMEFVGATNDSPVRIGNRIFPRGTLLYAGMNTSVSFDTLGERTDEIEYIMLGNYEREWNDVIQSDSLFYLVNTKADGTGDYAYPYLDFWTGLP